MKGDIKMTKSYKSIKIEIKPNRTIGTGRFLYNP